MPASSPEPRIGPAARAALYLAALATILWSAASVIAGHQRVLALYDGSLGSIPAYLYLEALSHALDAPPRLVLLVGPSTVREGFDAAAMSKLSPGTTFVNAGVTSPGTMPHTELLVDIVAGYQLDIDEIVLGLNSRMLAARPSPIASTRYVDAVSYEQGLHYLQFEDPAARVRAALELEQNRVWPLRRIRIRLDYLIRQALFEANQALHWRPLPRSAFERGGDRLAHRAGFLYSEQRHRPELLQRHLQSMISLGLLDPARYGGAETVASMRRTLHKAQRVADRVTVVIMPEHSVAREGFGRFGDRPFNAVLDEFRARGVRVIDRRAAIEDELIRDLAHLVPDGRARLSRDVAAVLAGVAPAGEARAERMP